MYKLILIDDDIRIIEGIKKHIPLKSMDIELVAEAYNGKDGLEKIKKYNPDIIFCDIQMPQMTGFDMIDCIRELSFTPQIIMLTGFNDFDHAKLAIDANVLSYLVKPAMPDEIIEALKKAINVCNEQRKLQLEKTHVSDNLSMIREQIIEKLFNANSYTNEEIKRIEEQYSILLENRHLCCISLLFDNISFTEKKNIAHTFYNAFSKKYTIYCGNSSGETISFLFTSSEIIIASELECSIDEFIKSHNSPVFITIGSITSSVEHISTSYRHSIEIQEYSFCFCNQGCLSFDHAIREVSQYKKHPLHLNKNVLNLAVESKNLGQISDILNSIDEKISNFVVYDTSHIKTLAFEFCSTIFYESDEIDISSSNSELHDIWLEIKATKTREDLIEYCRSIIFDFGKITKKTNSSTEKEIVEIMIKYIEENYEEKISLVALSHQLFLSRNYLRIIFRKNVGIDFTNYLQNFRMLRAAELILLNKYNISDIAEKVGYRDLKAFRNCFFEHFGMMPSEYKKNRS